MSADVSVSPAIDELLLRSDWLEQNKCKWDFSAGTVYIGDLLIRTHWKGSLDVSRRVFVSEHCVVPPRHEANVEVRVVCDNLSCPATEWAVEP